MAPVQATADPELGRRLGWGEQGWFEIFGICLCLSAPDPRHLSQRDKTCLVPGLRHLSRHDMTFGHISEKNPARGRENAFLNENPSKP